LSNQRDIDLAAKVLWVRHAQLAINERLHAGEFKIPVHLALGHEAIAVALTETLTPPDRLLLSHRNLHYNLCLCGKVMPIMAEFQGHDHGIVRGELGSMNLSQPKNGLSYTSSILGNNLAVAAGVAAALKFRGDDGAAFVVTGDGAMEEGVFYETLLMAGSADAPLVIVVENNGWSMYTQIEERRRVIDVEGYASSLGAGYLSSAGNDVVASTDAFQEARTIALTRGGPCVVEVSVSTLGEIVRDDRLINYHHGAAPEVAWEEWPILGESADDPVALLADRLPEDEIRRLSTAAFEAVKSECR
jgi:TPP-dependent pyruvate/acetoin dehydrogenase alpha subunit